MDWSILDIVLSVVLLIFGVHGLTEGFARQLATLITFFLPWLDSILPIHCCLNI